MPDRMTYSVIGQSDAGRDQYGVVVNAMETLEQQVALPELAELPREGADRPGAPRRRSCSRTATT